MKRKILLLLAIVACYGATMAQSISEIQKAKDYLDKKGEVRLKFTVNNPLEIRTLTKIVSIDNFDGKTVEAYANQKEFEAFKKLNIDFEAMPAAGEGNKAIVMANTVAEMANWDRYPTYDVYLEMMTNFTNDYPSLCQLDTIGYSVEGRIILAVKISDNVSQEEAEPEFFYTSSMHGDELTGFVLMLRLADYLLSNYGTLPEITNLVDNIEIYINPAANPDGTYNGGNSTVADATRYNSNGVDINRDFPDPRIGANSPYAAETQAMIDYAEENSFDMAGNFHGGIELVNYPWDAWTGGSPDYHPHPDNDWFFEISTDYAVSCQNNSPSGYMTGLGSGVTNGGDWYVVSGGRQDFMNFYHHCKEICFEISDTKLISSDQLPAHWNYNYQALLAYIEEVLYGFNGTVTNESGDPLYASITIASHDAENSNAVTDPDNGDYHRPIQPGTYDVTYSSYGYISQTHTITVTDYQTSVVQNVVLTASSSISLSGTVVDGTTGDPIENVSVELVDVPISAATTNASGSYSFANILEDTYQFKLMHDDYATVIESHAVSASNNVIDFVMYPVEAISFEEGTIPEGFTQGGDADWFVDNSEAYHGSNSLKSGDIDDDQSSEITLTFTAENDGVISFAKKVSSESGWDYLKFYIDNAEQDAWSGEVDWTEETYNITAGSHTLKWSYEKDGSQSNGGDCAWIDYIILPPTQSANPILSVNTDTIEVALLEGNSTTSTFNVSNIGEGTLDYTITIENAASNTWLSVSPMSGSLGASSSDEITATIDATSLSQGTYETNILVSDGTKTQKTVVVVAEVGDIAVNDLESNKIEIYPNPFNNQLILSINSIANEKVVIEFYNVLGENVLTKTLTLNKGANKETINTSSLEGGCYFYVFKTENNIQQGKLIKQ